MRNILKLGILASLAAALSYGESWTGKLVDATCIPVKEQPAKCDANKGTTSFAIENADGTRYKLDAEGNVKTGAAMGGFPDAKGPQVKVTGTMMTVIGDEKFLKVEAIEIR